MRILFCSVGRRVELIKNFKDSMKEEVYIVAIDSSKYAPAIYLADKYYIVPLISDKKYLSIIIQICKEEKIQAITTFIDPEIEILSKNRREFEQIGVEVLAPYEETAKLCFDKYLMYKYLKKNNIRTILTYGSLEEFNEGFEKGEIDFPVFVKPRNGSGSVGARKIISYEVLKEAVNCDNSLIIQELMECTDIDADVYIDTISHKAITAFSKKKLETRIGGASKTISFKDSKLFDFIKKICSIMNLNGPVDMDFFYKDGNYYLSEINPRFGGAYLHAYGAGVDFIKLINNNVNGIKNEESFGKYDDNIVMMMYDSVVIRHM